MSQGQVHLVPKHIDLNMSLNSCIDLIQYKAKEKGLSLNYKNELAT